MKIKTPYKKTIYEIGSVPDILNEPMSIYSDLSVFSKYRWFEGMVALIPFFIYTQRSYMLKSSIHNNEQNISKLIIDIKYILSSVRPEIYNIFKHICNSNVKDYNIYVSSYRIKLESKSESNKLKTLTFKLSFEQELESIRLNSGDIRCTPEEMFLLFGAVCSIVHIKDTQDKIAREQFAIKRIEHELGKFK